MTTPITKEPLYAEVHNVPDDYHFTDAELERIIAGDMFTPRQGAIMAREIQERRKAAMDAEPVYQWSERYEEGNLWEDCTKEQYDGFAKNPECETRVLYTAPPAPVVNAEPVADVVAWHKEGEERTCDIRWRRFDVAPGPLFAVAQPVEVVPEEMNFSAACNFVQINGMAKEDRVTLAMRAWNACRAAMLNHSENERDMVQRVSQPYKLPDNSFTDDDLEMMAHGDNPQSNAYRELLAFRRNSPVITDRLNVRAVAALREAVRNQWLKSEDFADKVYWKSMHDIANEIVSAMLAAAPQQEGE